MVLMDKIREVAKSLIEKLSVTDATIDIVEENGGWKISINSSDERTLIGRDNDKYEAFSHLLKRILSKDLGEETKIFVDINGMRAKNDESLKAKAMIVAGRAREFKRDVEMDPMSSYERMVIHTALENEPNIKTESVGEGRNRRLIVRFVE